MPCHQARVKAALALLEAGESEALIFTKVDRASRCTEDFARLIRLSEEQDWLLIVKRNPRLRRFCLCLAGGSDFWRLWPFGVPLGDAQ